MKHSFEKYCKDYKNIENYEKAKKDNFKGWECHHRLETHTPDGKRRDEDISHKELIALGMYWHRPPEELIFLTIKEHNAFKKGKKFSEEHKKKIGETRRKYTGEKHPMYGKHHSEETKNKLRETSRMNNLGRHWYNDGKISKRAYKCPPGFVPGRLRK